jgi:hypothetical protein
MNQTARILDSQQTESSVSGIRKEAIITVLLAAALASLAANLAVRALAFGLLGVPSDLATLDTSHLLPPTFIPVLGNTFGFYMVYRKSPERSLWYFLIPSLCFTVLGLTVSFIALPAGADVASVLVTAAINLVPVALVVPPLLMLRLRSESALVTHMGG